MKCRVFFVLALLLAGSLRAGTQARVLSLEECKSLSSTNDPYLKNARLDILAARQQRGEARSAYFPQVSITALGFHALDPLVDIGVTDLLGTSDAAREVSNQFTAYASQYGMHSRFQALQHGYGAAVNVMQPLYAGGRIAAGNRLAALGVQASELKQGLCARQDNEKVEEKFWRIVSLQEKQQTLQVAIHLLDTLSRDVGTALAAGLVTEVDDMQVRLKMAELQSKGIELKGGLRLAKMDLFNAIGLPYSPLENHADSLHPFIDDVTLEGVPSDALTDPQSVWVDEYTHASHMQESNLLALQVEAKRLEKQMVVGESLPQVAVGGTYGYAQYLGQPRDNGLVYAVVKIPVSDWNKNVHKLRRYQYEVEKAGNEKAYLDAQLVLKARQLWVNLQTAWEQLQVADQATDYARTLYTKKRNEYLAGLCTMAELLQAETECRQSEDACIDSKIAYLTALNAYQVR